MHDQIQGTHTRKCNYALKSRYATMDTYTNKPELFKPSHIASWLAIYIN